MDPAGMVHALEIIHDLLKQDGTLLDVRPKGFPAEFYTQYGTSRELLGHIDETDGFVEYRQAAWAMEQVIDRKLFRLQASGEYDFWIHADTFDELKAYMQIEWTDAVVDASFESRAKQLGAEKILLHDFIRFGVMQRV